MPRAFIDAIRGPKWFTATVIRDGFPYRFERCPEYPLVTAGDLPKLLAGAHVIAFEGALEAIREELRGALLPAFETRGARPQGSARTLNEARCATQRNAELLSRPPVRSVERYLEELGL